MITSGGSYLLTVTTGAGVVVPIPTPDGKIEEPRVIFPLPTLVTDTLVMIPTCVEIDPAVVWAIETKEPGLIPDVVATDTMVVPATATAVIVVNLSCTKSV